MTRLVDGGVEGEEYGLYSIADSDRRVVGAFQTGRGGVIPVSKTPPCWAMAAICQVQSGRRLVHQAHQKADEQGGFCPTAADHRRRHQSAYCTPRTDQ